MADANPPSAPTLLGMAAALTVAQLDRAAHALGWPGAYAITNRGGKLRKHVKWRHPFRNYYFCSATDDAWLLLQKHGLAEVEPSRIALAGDPTPPTNVYWRLTPLGIAVVRARLQAEIDAARLLAREVAGG